MRPKEIQQKLGIGADRIKLFKREGVFTPENPPSGNHGTNYTERDYENLRFLVILTKCGLTCSDIRKLQDGECTLEEAILSRRQLIEDDIARKRNSLSLLSELLDEKAEFETFDTDHYWDIITQRESEGDEFIDFEDTYGYRSVSLIRKVQCPYCGEEPEFDLEDFQYDQSSDEKENGMGPDIVYSFDSEDSTECPSCKKKFRIYGWIREYPVGAYDSEQIDVDKIQNDK